MEDAEIRIQLILTDAALAGVLEAIVNKSVLLLASEPEAQYETPKARHANLGGMLELARRLNDQRLVRALETHKDVLSRKLEEL
ncbi:MAG: hypothetical protein IRZ28_21970 [Steroidobacteraceae bacterium]|jgi:hypothetical protein|nr:hypothetical protein [Steroidobacteraceae bacterium]